MFKKKKTNKIWEHHCVKKKNLRTTLCKRKKTKNMVDIVFLLYTEEIDWNKSLFSFGGACFI